MDQCRGVEYPVLVTFTQGWGGYTTISSLLDVCTRVTSALFMVHMERSYDLLSDGLRVALQQREAVE